MRHRFFLPTLETGRVRFSPEQAHQIRTVLRLRPGDRVCVFDGREPIDHVVELASPTEGRIVDQAPQAPEPRTCLVACPALLPRDKFEQVLQKLTEVGVSAIQPVVTARALVREQPDEHRLTRWRAILREATEQSGRGRVPDLRRAHWFPHVIANAEGTLLVAAAGVPGLSIRAALAQARHTISFVVGPEGGFEPDEIDSARRAGARVVSLGPRTLRAETASPVLAALVLYEQGELA
jgi:16S rRNA (uracil1498-N3)-methyltransferase